MKKLVILIVATMCSYSVFAVNGPYLGAGLGYSNAVFNIDQKATATIGSITGQDWKWYHGIVGGIQWQLLAGYAYDLNKYRLGAEITAKLPKITHTDGGSSDSSYDYEFTYAYGVNFVPGYYITDRNLLYLKIGATRGKFTYKNITNSKYTILDTSFYSTGFNLGLGTEIYLTKSFRLKLEYLYTNYAAQKFTRNLALPENIAVAVDTKIHPKVHTVMLGIDYQFDLF